MRGRVLMHRYHCVSLHFMTLSTFALTYPTPHSQKKRANEPIVPLQKKKPLPAVAAEPDAPPLAPKKKTPVAARKKLPPTAPVSVSVERDVSVVTGQPRSPVVGSGGQDGHDSSESEEFEEGETGGSSPVDASLDLEKEADIDIDEAVSDVEDP